MKGTEETTTGNVILKGTVGSKAYGLDHANSDEDKLGIYVAPIDEVLGLRGPQVVAKSIQKHDPDESYHELGKYVSLALKANPTILELLFLEKYEIEQPVATALIAQRDYFLSAKVLKTYGEYARAQAERIRRKMIEAKMLVMPPINWADEKVVAGVGVSDTSGIQKHARHLWRLLLQAEELLKTGHLTVNVAPKREEIFWVGKQAIADFDGFYDRFRDKYYDLTQIKTVLPARPNEAAVNAFLVKARKEMP